MLYPLNVFFFIFFFFSEYSDTQSLKVKTKEQMELTCHSLKIWSWVKTTVEH